MPPEERREKRKELVSEAALRVRRCGGPAPI